MSLPKFLFIEPQAGMKGAGIILSTSPPFIYAHLFKSKKGDSANFEGYKATRQEWAFYQIPGYLIAVSYGGNLLNEKHIPTETIYNTLGVMAWFYHDEKIEASLGYYKKFQQ